jgi:transcriptional regulator with XRE-family HTH domain
MDIPTIIGDNLDRILTDYGIGRREFARAMGVPMSTYARMLHGTTVPFITTIYRALGAVNTVLLERGKMPIKIDEFLQGCPEYGTNS